MWVKVLVLPVIALVMAIVYTFALHPASGMFGGAYYLLFGSWFIPSAINLLLSAWIVSFIRVHWAWRVVLFVAASFLLGMNTLLPSLIRPNPVPVSSTQIIRVIRIPQSMRVDQGWIAPALPDEVSGTLAPSALGVQVGSNEACMCMWFTPPVGESTDWQVWHVINAYLHRRDIIDSANYNDAGMRRMAPGGAHFEMKFTRSATPKTVDLLLTIYDGLDVTAIYKQADIPVWSTLPSPPPPRTSELGGEHFYRNALSMLVRHNFWVFFLDSRMSGFSPEPLKAFLRRAVIAER
jgi:hypothetical protein